MLDGVNFIFTIILLILCLAFGVDLRNNGKTKFVQAAPILVTSIGIFGTFFGIVIALLGFDGIDNIKEQIDIIISGMQTAFVTSVLGLFLSIILKFIIILKKDDDSSDDVASNELIERFVWQTENINHLVEKIDNLTNAIGKDGENSLLGQVRLLRADFSDNQKQQKSISEQQLEFSKKSLQLAMKSYQDKQAFEQKLWQEMDKVTQTLAKSATETIIKALKDVITDFNNNLTEQFGENFKELNNAVFKLIKWQENYKQQITNMTEQYQLGVQAIDDTKNAIANIETSSRAIPQLMSNLGLVINDNQIKLDELTKHLQTFADIREQAIEALPEIQSHITLVLENMEQGTHEIKNAMINMTDEFNNNTQDCLSKLENTSKIIANRANEIDQKLQNITYSIEQGVQSWLHNLEKALQTLHSDFQRMLSSMAQEQQEFVRQNIQKMERNIEEQYEAMQDDINKLLKATQENMAKTQEKSISDMGTSLVNITRKFADDYTKLTEQMERVIRQNGGFR